MSKDASASCFMRELFLVGFGSHDVGNDVDFGTSELLVMRGCGDGWGSWGLLGDCVGARGGCGGVGVAVVVGSIVANRAGLRLVVES